MDLEIKRWRQLAAGPEYSHPQQKVQFFPKTGHYTVRSQYTYTRPGSSSKGSSSSSVRPRFHQDSATNAMLSRVKPAGPRKKEVYSRLLDDLIDHQRNDIDTLWKGYLNPNVANQRLRGTDDPLYDMSNPNTTTTKNAAANATTTSIHTLTTSMANGINLGESSLAAPMTTSSLLTADGVPSIPALRASIQKRKDHLMSRIDKSSSMKTKPHYPMNENLSSAASASDKNGEMVYDLLEQYDSVKIQLERQREEDALFTNTTAAAVRANNNINNNAIQQDNDHPTQPQPVTPSATKLPTTKHGTTTTSITPHRTIMPHLALQTRTDRYQTMKTMNAEMISFPFNSRAQDKEKLDKLDEIHAFLQQALSELPNPQHNDGGGGGGEYNKRRMQIFGVVFERIIQDFKVFGPVLAEIKAEYDKIIQAVRTEDDEVDSLRAKVRKLLSQNENRLQLDFERKRGKKLQEELKIMQKENLELKKEHRRKLIMFATYLPDSLIEDEMEKDPNFHPQKFAEGEDPIAKMEKKITFLEKELSAKSESMDNLRRLQEEDYVPKALKDQLDYALKDAERKISALEESNYALDKLINDKSATLIHLEEQFKEKEEQYKYLIAEYK